VNSSCGLTLTRTPLVRSWRQALALEATLTPIPSDEDASRLFLGDFGKAVALWKLLKRLGLVTITHDSSPCADDSCANDPLAPYCLPLSGECVNCLTDGTCANPSFPFCLQNNCVQCLADRTSGDGSCDANAARTVCGTTGSLRGLCVECESNADCTSPNAVCDGGTCVQVRGDDLWVSRERGDPWFTPDTSLLSGFSCGLSFRDERAVRTAYPLPAHSDARSLDPSIARSLDRSIPRSLDPSIARSLDRSLDRSLTAVHRRRRLSLGRGQVFRHSSLRDVLRRAGLRSVPAPAGLHPALPGVGHRRWGRTPPAHDAQRNHEALVPYVQRGRPPMSGESTVVQLWDMRAGGHCRPH